MADARLEEILEQFLDEEGVQDWIENGTEQAYSLLLWDRYGAWQVMTTSLETGSYFLEIYWRESQSLAALGVAKGIPQMEVCNKLISMPLMGILWLEMLESDDFLIP